jgi:FtsH-binding integral membrane protein
MSRHLRTGLILLGLLALFDLPGPAMTDGEHPPMSIAIAGSVLGVASLACLLPARRGSRVALITLVTLRLVSALTAVPAFFVADVPAPAVVAAAGIVALTVVGVVLVLAAGREQVAGFAR